MQIFKFNLQILEKIANFVFLTGRSTARLARLLWEQEVAGSNPAAPTNALNSIFQQFSYFFI